MKLSVFSIALFITHLSYLFFVNVFLRLLSVYESILFPEKYNVRNREAILRLDVRVAILVF